MRERPPDFIEEDWLLIAEALVNWAGPPESVDTKRGGRAYQLVEAIAFDQDMTLEELQTRLESVDHELTPHGELD